MLKKIIICLAVLTAVLGGVLYGYRNASARLGCSFVNLENGTCVPDNVIEDIPPKSYDVPVDTSCYSGGSILGIGGGGLQQCRSRGEVLGEAYSFKTYPTAVDPTPDQNASIFVCVNASGVLNDGMCWGWNKYSPNAYSHEINVYEQDGGSIRRGYRYFLLEVDVHDSHQNPNWHTQHLDGHGIKFSGGPSANGDTINWSVIAADNATLLQDGAQVAGGALSPPYGSKGEFQGGSFDYKEGPTNFVLRASGPNEYGQYTTFDLPVNLNISPPSVTTSTPPEPTSTTPVTPVAEPFCSLGFSPSTVNAGQSTVATWNSSNDADEIIHYDCGGNIGSGDLTPANGQRTLTPSETQICTLTVANSRGSRTCSDRVVVIPPPRPGTGTVCVRPDTNDGYRVIGPDQAWGWNGDNCFSGHLVGPYSVDAPGGSVKPSGSVVLHDKEIITFYVTFIKPIVTPPKNGEVCVNANTQDGYIVHAPDQNFGWNGSKCFGDRPPGIYWIDAPGGSVYPSTSLNLPSGGKITFNITFGGPPPPTPGIGTVCVKTDTSARGYIISGPDQAWGWNGDKCFGNRVTGNYGVSSDPGIPVCPSSGVLTNGGTLNFKVNLGTCSSGPTTPTPVTHGECQSGSCVQILGPGGGCSLDSQCRHNICSADGACVQVLSPGASNSCANAGDPDAPECPQPPPSCTFSASPDRVVVPPPHKVTLSWNCRKAHFGCTISPGVGSVGQSGSASVSVSQDTNYTLSCSGRGGSGLWNATVRAFEYSGGKLKEVVP